MHADFLYGTATRPTKDKACPCSSNCSDATWPEVLGNFIPFQGLIQSRPLWGRIFYAIFAECPDLWSGSFTCIVSGTAANIKQEGEKLQLTEIARGQKAQVAVLGQ